MTETRCLEPFRMVVVPIGVGIDQSSDIEEILACPEAVLYPLTDYAKMQNDEELPDTYWSFLVNIHDECDLTGANIDGIHCNLIG